MMIILLGWDYLRQGTLVVAARYFHHKEYDKAGRVLMEVFKPEWLSKNRRGYYEFLMGGVCLQKQDFEDAEKHYEIAAQYPLRSVNDHVAALVHIANISIRQGNYDKADAYLQPVYIGAANLFFTLLAMTMIDKFGRKTLLLVGAAGMIVFLGLTAYAFSPGGTMGTNVLIYLLCFISKSRYICCVLIFR